MTAPTHLDLTTRSISELLATCGEHRLVQTVVDQGPCWLVAAAPLSADGPWYRTDGAGRRLLLPGSLALEVAVQAGELLVFAERGGRPAEDGVPVLARVKGARFERPVAPGTGLEARVSLNGQVGPAYYVHAEIHTEEGRAMAAELVFTATAAVTLDRPA